MDPSTASTSWLIACGGLFLLLQAVLFRMQVRAFQNRRDASLDLARDHNSFLYAILNSFDQAICILDEQARVIDGNRNWVDFATSASSGGLGSPGESFIGFCEDSGAYGEGGAKRLRHAVQEVVSGQSDRYEGEFETDDKGAGRVIGLRVLPLPGHERGSAVLLQWDKTAERRAENTLRLQKYKAEILADALETSQKSLELATQGGNLGLWHWDIESGYFDLKAEWLTSQCYEAGEVAQADIETFRKILHPEDGVLWTAEDATSLAPGEPYDRQFRLRRPDGSYTWVQVLGNATGQNPDGSPERLTGVLIDIDARKATELRDAGMVKIIEECFNEVFVIDRKTKKFVEVNRGARLNLGYSLEELREMSPIDIKLAGTEQEFHERIELLNSGRSDRLEFETTHVRRDGSSYPMLLNVQPARLVDRDVFVAIGVDLSQRRELETQLANAQRLESIGQLAAGVAHEMNTPLQFVGNNIQFLSDCSSTLFGVVDALREVIAPNAPPRSWRERYEELQRTVTESRFERLRSEAPKAIEESLEGIGRVIQIVRAMKEFSHPGSRDKSLADLNHAIESAVTVTRNRWKGACDLDLELASDLPRVECEVSGVNQVLVNLIVNAADALAERTASDPDSPAGRIVVRTQQVGDEAVVEVEDNGCGMPEDVAKKAFDPFFTTKEVGKGTGQGLSLTHTIVVQKHGGSISIKSTPGEGTVIRFSLPLKAGVPESPKPKWEEHVVI